MENVTEYLINYSKLDKTFWKYVDEEGKVINAKEIKTTATRENVVLVDKIRDLIEASDSKNDDRYARGCNKEIVIRYVKSNDFLAKMVDGLKSLEDGKYKLGINKLENSEEIFSERFYPRN